MTTFSKDYRAEFSSAIASSDLQKATELFTALCNEAGVPAPQNEDDDDKAVEDPQTVKIQVELGRKLAEHQNKQDELRRQGEARITGRKV